MASYYYSLIGGSMLASSIYHLYYYNGNVLGVSGIYGSFLQRTIALVQSPFKHTLSPKVTTKSPQPTTYGTATPTTTEAKEESKPVSETNWKLAFLAGLLLGGMFLRSFRSVLESRLGVPIFDDEALKQMSNHPLMTLFLGLLIGAGTRVAKGCTSGHMLCGVSRLSPRSIVATTAFFAVAVGVVKLLHLQRPRAPGPTKFDPVTVLLMQLPLVFYRYIIPKITPPNHYKLVSSFAIAVHFAFGLALAGMLQPSKIQNFLLLPVSPGFDPSLLFVAIGGLMPNLIAWIAHLRHTEKPLFSSEFVLPTDHAIDLKLIVGSVIFGAGWGAIGVCPGPGLVLTGAFAEKWKSTGIWVLGVSSGMILVRLLEHMIESLEQVEEM